MTILFSPHSRRVFCVAISYFALFAQNGYKLLAIDFKVCRELAVDCRVSLSSYKYHKIAF